MTTIEQIKDNNRRAGGHFFDRDTLRFFRSRVSDNVHEGPGGVFFVTSEQGPNSPRRYTVRQALDNEVDGCQLGPGALVHTVGDFQAYDSSRAAHAAAQRFARDGLGMAA